MAGVVEGIYIAPEGGAPLEHVEEAEAVMGTAWKATVTVRGRGTGAASAGAGPATLAGSTRR